MKTHKFIRNKIRKKGISNCNINYSDRKVTNVGVEEEKDKVKKIETTKHRQFTIIVLASLILIFTAIASIHLLRDVLKSILLPDIAKEVFIDYTFTTPEGFNLPVNIQYVTNNGKLFAASNGISSVIIALIWVFLGRFVFKEIFTRSKEHISLKSIISFIKVSVLLLSVFVFAARVDSNRNFDEYKVNRVNSSYAESSKLSLIDKSSVIGYLKRADVNSDEQLITVYISPSIESNPHTKGNLIEYVATCITSNIEEIGLFFESLTISSGVILLAFTTYQDLYEKKYKESI